MLKQYGVTNKQIPAIPGSSSTNLLTKTLKLCKNETIT
nr:MAG TPA: hypothetical protein [Bacteriophage sp.]DAW98778.1 MAG TPA: hypothetical protein [Caudoviricetes sp.]